MDIILNLIWILFIVSVIFLENKNPGEALFWTVIIVCTRYVGIVLYMLFGSTLSIKLTMFVRKQRFTTAWRAHAYNSVSSAKTQDAESFSRVSSQVIGFNSSYNDSRLTACSSHTFYTDGIAHYEQLFKDISEATENIHILFYTIHNDETGHQLVSLLTEKAKQGVKVWVMFDFLANMRSTPRMYRELKKAGGVVKRLKPLIHQFRSHRKIVVIDNKIGYIGGMNVGNKYAGCDRLKTPWRDTQVRLEGDCICELQEYFLKDWVCVISKKQGLSMMPEFLQTAQRIRETPKTGGAPCQFITGGVDTDKRSIEMCYLSLIRSAEKSIKIQSPYFIPTSSVLDALKVAASSGVKVEIMIPGIASSFFLEPVTRYYCGQMLEVGAKILKYRGYIHAKTITVDDQLCCLGSVNTDVRSLALDDEICGVFYDSDFVAEYLGIFEKDSESCDEYSLEEFQRRGGMDKFAEHVFLLAAPLM